MKSSQFINFDNDVLRRFILFQQQQPKVDRKAVIQKLKNWISRFRIWPHVVLHLVIWHHHPYPHIQYELEEMFIEKVKNVSRLQILPFSRQINVCKT